MAVGSLQGVRLLRVKSFTGMALHDSYSGPGESMQLWPDYVTQGTYQSMSASMTASSMTSGTYKQITAAVIKHCYDLTSYKQMQTALINRLQT